MLYDGIILCMMGLMVPDVQNDAKFSRIVSDDSGWCTMVQDSARWYRIVRVNAGWCRAVSDGAEWFIMD